MLWLSIFFLLFTGLAFYRVKLLIGGLLISLVLILHYLSNGQGGISFLLLGGLSIISVFCIAPLRRQFLSAPLLRIMKKNLPPVSQTEQEALEAGTIWWDGQLFSGQPNWEIIEKLQSPNLSETEQAYLDGPVETLCEMLDDWDITHHRRDLPPEVWEFIKVNQFCGLIIPEHYGGLDFSHYAHSQIVMKIASRCTSAAVTVMVPNSLGPAKLLLEYGTQQQKDHYLPRLATGQEIPCFALTGPQAGSDASAMPDTGIVCFAAFEDQPQVLGIRLNWEKRYITLGPVATVLGLAFKLFDPDHILGEKEALGITVALIPTQTPGVEIGKRHFPLDSAFQNGPNWGKDVFIPMDWIIGGQKQIGNGWKMLVQCLTTGRGISLPALSAGATKFTSRNCGAYARIRTQFNRAIGDFEGIQEVLARIAGETYILDAARSLTLAALDDGQKPAVLTAIIKYEATEMMRRVVNDGMDIQGGSGICLGPHNYLGRLYQVIPVGITVEGANILTRTMMIFGQGAMRCHPYIQDEIQCLHDQDSKQGLLNFDRLITQHAGFILHNCVASGLYGLSNGRLLNTPGNIETKKYYQQINRLSVNFALLADYALITLGGGLKRKERLSGCFADALSHLYLCTAVLKHFHNQGEQEADRALLHWSAQHTLYQAQQALTAVLSKLPLPIASKVFYGLIFPLGQNLKPPSDHLEAQLADILLTDNSARDRLTDGIFINQNPDDATGRIEFAFKAVLAAAPVEIILHEAQKKKQLEKGKAMDVMQAALDNQIINQQQADLLIQAEQARLVAIQVDDFTTEQLSPSEEYAINKMA